MSSVKKKVAFDKQVVDIGSDGCFISKYRGHIRIEKKDSKAGKAKKSDIPIDEIEAIIVHGRHGGYSHQSLVALAEEGVPVVLCDANHRPKCWFWPLEGHFEQTRRMAAQLSLKPGLRKRLWGSIIKEKIRNQGRVLKSIGINSRRFTIWARDVRPGDPKNLEAQAALVYWPLLFGDGFIRNTRTPGVNARLNYGYTVLRAAVARHLMSAGLHLSIGLFHRNRFNAWCLADDLMEPFRPFFDLAVWQQTSGQNILLSSVSDDMDLEIRTMLVQVLSKEVKMSSGVTSLSTATKLAAKSLANSIMEGTDNLVWPSEVD